MNVSVNVNETKPKIFYKGEEIQPLLAQEVYRRQRIFGKNIIEKHSSRSWHSILLNSLLDPFNLLLIGISCLSLFLNDYQTFIIMIIMVMISAAIRFFREQQSETKLNDLTSMVKKSITVIRLEYEEIIDLTDCVPGDFIKLSAGDRIPADIQLIKANSLFVDQSILTGESMPCLKYVEKIGDVSINYDLNEIDFYNLRKKKTWSDKLKGSVFSCLKDNFGLELSFEKVTFDNKVLAKFDINDPARIFMGTNVISGSCLGVVLATGKCTFFGIMSEQISFHKPVTSFSKGIKQISLIFILFMGIITVPVILIKGFDIFNENSELSTKERWIYAAQFALSVAIGLTPEMLPLVTNSNLAKGAIILSKNCVVKRIEAITNLGSMNILCTDKTGTLTENFAQLCNIFDYKKQDCLIGLELAYLNSAYQEAFKNLIDQAIIQAYEDKAKQQTKNFGPSEFSLHKIKEIPFDFSRRKMTVVYEIPELNIRILITKGAVHEMLDVCSYYLDKEFRSKDDDVLPIHNLLKELKKASKLKTIDETILSKDNKSISKVESIKDLKKDFDLNIKLKKLTPEIIKKLSDFNDLLNQDGYRVLALAYQIENIDTESSIDLTVQTSRKSSSISKMSTKKRSKDKLNEKKQNSNLKEKDLIFVSYLTFLNPPKTSAAKAIRDLILNNVKVKVLTGDTQEVCKNVCKQIGLSTTSMMTSKELNGLNEEELKKASIKTVIFSQLTPIQKFNIVRILKKQKHVVGFLGDGINDVMALKEADVGISVDSGTEIAKDAADIILLEKELDVINIGVICGRRAFANTIKYISMAISGNFGNVISIFISCIWLPFLPMAPIHILLQNLLYDISQMTMPWDNVDKDILIKPEVFKLRNLLCFMIFWGPVSSFFDVLTFAYLYFYYDIKTPKDNTVLFQTGWFTVGLLTQTLICHIARTHRIPVIQSNASFNVYLSTITTLVFGLVLPHMPLGETFSMTKLTVDFYYFLIFILITYCVSVQLLKAFYIYLFNSWFTSF